MGRFSLGWLLLVAGCAGAGSEDPSSPPRPVAGADLSEALYAERAGVLFRDRDGTPEPVLRIFAERGYAAARLRINVDPPDAPDYAMFTDVDYATELAVAARAEGLRLLVDLHYSHWWADPANQWTPEPWRTMDTEALAETVRAWTEATIARLIAAGAPPDAVQIGNEIAHGMLWDLGGPHRPGGSWGNLARFVRAGVEGLRAAGSDAQVVLHLESGGDLEATRAWIAAFEAAGGPWDEVDVLGLSYYPMWQGSLRDLDETLRGLAVAYPDKAVSIVETAFYWSPHEADFGEVSWPWPETRAGQARYLEDLRAVLERHPQVESVYYWGAAWAQSERWLVAPGWPDDDASRRSLFDDDGVATPAIDALVR